MHETTPANAGQGGRPDVSAPADGRMPLAGHIEEALKGPMTSAALDTLAATIWRAHGAGALDEAEAERLDALMRARRARMSTEGRVTSRPVLRRPPRPRSPDRAASIARRRRHAASGAVPPQIAAEFTQGQVAVLSVVGRAAARGLCNWPMDKIAALAGVCRTVVRDALRLAQTLGLLRVTERRRRGARSETNLVRITAPTWSRWLCRASRTSRGQSKKPGGGFGNTKTTNTQDFGKECRAKERESCLDKKGFQTLRGAIVGSQPKPKKLRPG